MLSCWGRGTTLCDGITRREVLRLGGLAFGGLTLADLLRSRAAAGDSALPTRSVIMIWLRGGPSHIDSYDMKPGAPADVRGEFRPIGTRVPGIAVCEYLPRHAAMMERLAILRGIQSNDLGDHTPHYILTGFPDRGKRPTLGAITSYLHPQQDGIPRYVSSFNTPYESSTYTGPAHRPFVPDGAGVANLSLAKGVSLGRLSDRRQLLAQFDTFRRDLDAGANLAAHDAFTRKALETIASSKVRDAFDLKQESDETRARYGDYCKQLLMARRAVEAGVSVVTVKIGDWDTHEKNFIDMRDQLPKLDQGFSALIDDLYNRGLERDVAVVMWGEFGRAPKISRGDGRDHWPEAGAAVVGGGGFRVGQAIGETDAHGGRAKGRPYTPSNVLATLYRHLGIDTTTTIPDHTNRPMHVLDDREPIRELLPLG
jgi:hypothetical protein